MNLVDLIKDQLTSATIGNLSSLIGENEAKTKSAVTSAVPAILSGLSSLASSSGGAQKLASAINSIDARALSNVDGMLSGQAGSLLEQGSGILNSLFGDKSMSGLVGALCRFLGIGGGATKSLMGYLTPLIMGTIASRAFGGKPVTAQGLTNLFAEQCENITDALPRGLSLADVPGLAPAREAARHASETVQSAASTAFNFKWLAPLLAVAAALLVLWFAFWRKPNEPIAKAPNININKDNPVVADRSYLDAKVADAAKAKLEEGKARLDEATRLGKDLTGVYGSLTESLTSIKDAASVEAALPKLEELNTKLDAMTGLWDKLPDSARSTVKSVTTDKLGGLRALIEKVMNIPGVREKLKPILDEILARLSALGA